MKRLDWLVAGVLLVSPVGFQTASVNAQEEIVFVNQQLPVAKVEVDILGLATYRMGMAGRSLWVLKQEESHA